jgi:microcystin degradation protein MlrC
MARIAVAGFLHETNTFSPLPTPYDAFTGPGGPYANFLRGQEIFSHRGKRLNDALCGFINTAEALGHQIVPILWTAAEPANQVTAAAFERIMGQIAAGLVEANRDQPLDGVYLDLHGAMVTQDFIDGETEILRRARAILDRNDGAEGDAPVVPPIVVSLDLHGNITRQSFEMATAMVGYRTYPHTDIYETGERCARILDQALGGASIFGAFRPVPFLMPISTQSTNTEPCKSLYGLIDQVEGGADVLSATIMAGFPPADVSHCGPTVFAYGRTPQAAKRAADLLYEAILAREADFALDLLDPDQAVRRAIQLSRGAGKPVILADVQDNSGGGATSDTPWVLAALVRQQAESAALGLMYDPAAAEAAFAAGEGARISLGLGGKLTPGQQPFTAEFLVKRLFEGEFTATGPMLKGMPINLGKMANLQVGGVQVVVTSRRTQANDQSYFRQVGIEPAEMKILALKSSNHYRADFEPISSAILVVEAPGAIVEDPSKAAYRNLRPGVRLKGLGPIFKPEA